MPHYRTLRISVVHHPNRVQENTLMPWCDVEIPEVSMHIIAYDLLNMKYVKGGVTKF